MPLYIVMLNGVKHLNTSTLCYGCAIGQILLFVQDDRMAVRMTGWLLG